MLQKFPTNEPDLVVEATTTVAVAGVLPLASAQSAKPRLWDVSVWVPRSNVNGSPYLAENYAALIVLVDVDSVASQASTGTSTRNRFAISVRGSRATFFARSITAQIIAISENRFVPIAPATNPRMEVSCRMATIDAPLPQQQTQLSYGIGAPSFAGAMAAQLPMFSTEFCLLGGSLTTTQLEFLDPGLNALVDPNNGMAILYDDWRACTEWTALHPLAAAVNLPLGVTMLTR